MDDNEWYEKYKKDVGAALTKSKSAARDDAVHCALVKAHDGTFLLCAHVAAAKQAAMVQTAKSKGAKVVSSGLLFAADNGPTFEVSVGDVSVKAKVSAAAAEATGKPMNVHVVAAPDAPTPETPSAPPAPDAAAFRERFKKLVPLIQQAGQKAPDRKAALDQAASQAVAAGKAGDFVLALNIVGRLEAATAKILGAPGSAPSPSVSPPPPPPPVSPPVVDAAAFRERFKVVLPQYQQAAQKAPDHKAELDKIAAQAAGAAKAGDFARALELTEQLAAASTKVLQAGKSSESESNESESTEGEPGQQKKVSEPTDKGQSKESESNEREGEEAPHLDGTAFKARLKEVLPLYKQAIEKAPDRKEELTQLATQAGAAGNAHDYPKAIDLLDQLEARSRSALRVAGTKEEIETAAGKGNVVFRKWRAEKLSAASALKELQKAILGDTESASTVTDWDVITNEAGRLGEMVDVFSKFDSDLETSLETYYLSAPKERDAPRAAALDVVQKYRQTLKDDPAYEVLDNGAYGPIKIASVISAALDGLAAALK